MDHGAKVVYEAKSLFLADTGSGGAFLAGINPASGAAKPDLGSGQEKI